MYASEHKMAQVLQKTVRSSLYGYPELPCGPASQFLSIHTRKFEIQMFIFSKILHKSVQSNTLYSSQKLGTTQRTATDEHDIQTTEQHITVNWILKVYTYNPSILEAGGL